MAQIQSGASTDILTVDVTSKAARSTLYNTDGTTTIKAENTSPAQIYGLPILGRSDNKMKAIRVDKAGSIATAWGNLLFSEPFEGTTINPQRWVSTATTMTAAQTSGAGIQLNSGSSVAASVGYCLTSARRIIKVQKAGINIKIRANMISATNSVMEFGAGDMATAVGGTVQNGLFFQVTASNTIQFCIANNGSVITYGETPMSNFNTANYYTFDVAYDDDTILYNVQDLTTGNILIGGIISMPAGYQRMFATSALQTFARVYNTATPPATAPKLTVSDISAIQADVEMLRDTGTIFSVLDRGADSHPLTGAQLQANANSAEPASATLSNTTAGYTTLGGKFQFAAVAGSATDYALFAIQIPAPTNYVLRRISIDTWNTGAAVATTPTLLSWSIGRGTAASLATANDSRLYVGSQSLPVGAAPGALANRIDMDLPTPFMVPQGRYLKIILRMPVGTATASQVIAGAVTCVGYFD